MILSFFFSLLKMFRKDCQHSGEEQGQNIHKQEDFAYQALHSQGRRRFHKQE